MKVTFLYPLISARSTWVGTAFPLLTKWNDKHCEVKPHIQLSVGFNTTVHLHEFWEFAIYLYCLYVWWYDQKNTGDNVNFYIVAPVHTHTHTQKTAIMERISDMTLTFITQTPPERCAELVTFLDTLRSAETARCSCIPLWRPVSSPESHHNQHSNRALENYVTQSPLPYNCQMTRKKSCISEHLISVDCLF
jgi:hypothetical protein